MTGPSASGSENGTPTSSTSAPARSRARRIAAERGKSGSPAVVYVTRPVRRSDRMRAKVSVMRDGVLAIIFLCVVGPHPHDLPPLAPTARGAGLTRLSAQSTARDPLTCPTAPPALPALAPHHFLHRLHVLVAAARQIHHDDAARAELARHLARVRDRVRRFE